MIETARIYRRIAWLVVAPVMGLYDEDGNLLGVQRLQDEAIYFPHGANADAMVAAVNRKLSEESP